MDAAKPNKQRILDVFNGKMPDRVPNFEVLIDNPTLSAIMGRPMPVHTLGNIPPQDYLDVAGRIGQDVIGLCFYFSPFFYEDAQGCPKPLDFPIRSRDDLKRLLKPDLGWVQDRFDLLDQYAAAVSGTDTGLFVLLGSFMTTAYDQVFGFEPFMLSLFDDLPLVEEVLEIGADYYASITHLVCQRDLTFLYVGDDVAFKSATLIDPDLLRRIWLPRLKRIFAPALSRQIPILFHSDGNIRAIIPDLIDSGVRAINPIEPYGMDIRDIKRTFGKDLALIGNLDVGGSLSRGTPDDVRRDARALIEAVGHDGGLVLASSHSITPNVKPENFMAMVETAWTCRYT
ncbi:MAG: uroporphyrinogen decarboxylase family protein [Eubacteriales bacterium]|nr:uroporphyrinogen decarboxylase family protein [Eubacteriales bacterium]